MTFGPEVNLIRGDSQTVTAEQESAEDNLILREAVLVLRHQAGMVQKFGHEEEQRDALELWGLASALDETRRKHWTVPS